MAPSKDGEGFLCYPKEVYNDMGWMIQNARGYKINEEPYCAARKLRLIHIGAGASGITFSKFVEERLRNVELQIYEKNADIGGTWLENRFAGPSRLCVFADANIIVSKVSRLCLRYPVRLLSVHLGTKSKLVTVLFRVA